MDDHQPQESAAHTQFDAVLVLSFGGPDGPDDVIPFLENVTRGRGIPRHRLEAVAEHYMHLGGRSPINELNLALIDRLRDELDGRQIELPIYFGNRNWHPFAEDTLEQMYVAGHRRVLVFATSAWGGYSGCRQYHEDIDRAVTSLGDRAKDVVLRRLPQYNAHPKFLDAQADAVRAALARRADPAAETRVVFTAHSVPISADATAGPPDDGGHLYSSQVGAACQAIADRCGLGTYDQVWQSRSGPPQMPWLEPDICDHLKDVAAQGVQSVIVVPVGFISDHVEVIWDLDTEAAHLAGELGMELVRADTVDTDPQFVSMVADLITEQMTTDHKVLGVGENGALCAAGCCAQQR